MKSKIVIIVSVIITLVIVSLYYTYAIDVTIDEVNSSNADLTFNINITDTSGRTITVEAGETKYFDIFVTNNNEGTINYGLAYNGSEIEGITIAQVDTSKNKVSELIKENTTHQISMIIINETTTDYTYNIKTIVGYENGGDLIVDEGYTLIDDVYSIPVELTPSEQTLTKLGVNVNNTEVNTFGKIPYVTESELTTLCTNGGYDTLSACLTEYYSVSTYSELMATGYVSTVNDNGIFAAEDDLGTSYYYRGNVENNYVYFAGIYWRIMRINGDGTIRMIYDGPTKKHNGTMGDDNIVTTTAYNTNYDDNAYVGYMYGTPNSDYSNTHKNTTSSTIKGVNDKWYEDTIIAGGYDKYVADAIYCNDRKVTPGSYFGVESSGDGTGTTATSYDSLARIYGTTVSPTLKCSQDNDKFSTTAIGNGDLTYPIGLATTDELVMSGYFPYDLANDVALPSLSSYSFNYVPFWTMSPAVFRDGVAGVWYALGGFVIPGIGVGYDAFGLRPVVSLKSDTPFSSGDGSYNTPFIVG